MTSPHHKMPLNSRYHSFDSRNGYSSVLLVKMPICGFLVILLVKYLQFKNFNIPKLKGTWHVVQHDPNNFGNIEIFQLQLFAKIMTRKPKIGNLTDTCMTELYPFQESTKWYLLFKGILWSHDLLVKTINSSV